MGKKQLSACLQVLCGFFVCHQNDRREKSEHDRDRRTNRLSFGREAETEPQRKDFEEHDP